MSNPDDPANDANMPSVEHVYRPTEVLRLAAMARSVLEELYRQGLDETERSRVGALYRASLNELRGVLSDDLRAELDRLVQPLSDQPDPTGRELQVGEAQLSGWLDGLVQSLQAAVLAPQATPKGSPPAAPGSRVGDSQSEP
jgi:hypothetical protein